MIVKSLKLGGLSIIASGVAGFLFSIPFFGRAELGERWLGATTFFAALLLGFVAGEHLNHLRRQHWRPASHVVVLVAVMLTLAAIAALIGMQVRPLIGASENRFFFPFLFVVGVVGGLFGNRGNS